MPTETISDMQTDHRVWLRDIERWDYDVDIWQSHKAELLASAEHFVEIVKTFCDDVDAHGLAVADHRQRVVDCERNMVEHTSTDTEQRDLAESHQRNSELHDEHLSRHRRLEQLRHRLMAQLCALK